MKATAARPLASYELVEDFREAVGQAFRLAKERSETLSLLVFDLDPESWEDPSAADAALAEAAALQIARHVEQICPADHRLFRLGRTELAVMMSGVGRLQTAAIAQWLSSRLARLTSGPADSFRLPSLTTSVGCASTDDGLETATELMLRADESLYGHKIRQSCQRSRGLGPEAADSASMGRARTGSAA